MRRRSFFLVGLAAIGVVMTALSIGVYSVEKFQIRKIDFIAWSVVNESDSGFTSAVIGPYLRSTSGKISLEQAGFRFSVTYDGWFALRQWQIIARQ